MFVTASGNVRIASIYAGNVVMRTFRKYITTMQQMINITAPSTYYVTSMFVTHVQRRGEDMM